MLQFEDEDWFDDNVIYWWSWDCGRTANC